MNGESTSWTIMLFITADGTLTNFAVESLKQLNEAVSTLAGSGSTSVKIAAHFSFPGGATDPATAAAGAPASQTIREYIFPPAGGIASVLPTQVRTLPVTKTVLTQSNAPVKQALKAFLKRTYSNSNFNKSTNYALVLWGHGPELLLQPPPDNSTGDSNSLYLTPEELRKVLEGCKPRKGDFKLDIIGFDACFMSMFEMADELKGLAKYMVASQDEVPDLSFPYGNLIKLFQEPNTASLLTKVVQTYVSTYQDSICNNTTQMNPVTLSVLELKNCDALTKQVQSLACALWRAKDDKGLSDALIEARKYSNDYAGGLYVDLYDFCTKLSDQRNKLAKDKREPIRIACEAVRTAINVTKTGDSLILANGSVEFLKDRKNTEPLFDNNAKANHGISIYLPYLRDEQYSQVQKPLAKGTPGSHSGKGFGEALQGAGIEYLMVARRDLILDTESYYPNLKLAKETGWYDVITQVWTRALMKKVPADLDYHYSAQQSWMNVTRGPDRIATLCP
jgi:Clostripain family